MIHIAVMGLPLAIGLALAMAAARRGWAPPLWLALGTGTLLRLVVLAIAAQDDIQPYDLAEDFPAAADAVLTGHDPVASGQQGGWHFLPLLAYLLAGQSALGELLGLPWSIAGRLLPILTDIALIPLVGRLAALFAAHPAADPAAGPVAERRAAAASRCASFQYACVPLALMISAIHGQFAPITLLFAVAALLAARADRTAMGGLLTGLAVTSASWAVVVLPGVLAAVPAVRNRLTILAWTAAMPAAFLSSSSLLLDTPPHRLPATAAAALTARPVVGDWGWTAVMTGGRQMVSPTAGHIGAVLLVSGLLAAAWWWRTADPVALTLALLLVFLIVTYRFGSQYLLWPVPYLIARAGHPRQRGAWPALAAASVWAAAGYLHLTLQPWHLWLGPRIWWALSSLIVIAFLIRALPSRTPTSTHPPPTRDDGRTGIPEPIP